MNNTALWLLYYRFSPENADLLTTLGLLYLQVLKTVSCYINLIIFKMTKDFFLELISIQLPVTCTRLSKDCI